MIPFKVKRNILLNPGPATTTDSVKRALVVPDICPREKDFCDLLRGVREKIIRVVQGKSTHTAVMFASSGTGAIEACVSSLLDLNDKILIHINGAYGQRMLEIAQVFCRPDQIVVYEQPYGAFPEVNYIDEILARDSAIKYVGMVHHETTTGMLNPVDKLVALTKPRKVRLIVDAMSSFAGVPIDLQVTPYDFLVSSSNKCIQGMAGVSFVIADKEALSESKNHPLRNFYFNLWRQHAAFENGSQMLFTPPVQVFYALDRALEEYFEETGERRYERYVASWDVLVTGLRELQLELMLPLEWQSKLLTSIREPIHPNYHFKKMHDALYEKGFTIYPGKMPLNRTFRIANIGAINKNDMEAFVEQLRSYFQSMQK